MCGFGAKQGGNVKRKQCSLMIVLTLLAGLVGGMVSSQLFMGQVVFAETAQQNEQVVVAREFRLVDKRGKTRAVLRFSPGGGPSLAMIDENGKVRAAFGLVKDGTPFLGMLDKNGQPFWRAP
jgi:hypothetical protein